MPLPQMLTEQEISVLRNRYPDGLVCDQCARLIATRGYGGRPYKCAHCETEVPALAKAASERLAALSARPKPKYSREEQGAIDRGRMPMLAQKYSEGRPGRFPGTWAIAGPGFGSSAADRPGKVKPSGSKLPCRGCGKTPQETGDMVSSNVRDYLCSTCIGFQDEDYRYPDGTELPVLKIDAVSMPTRASHAQPKGVSCTRCGESRWPTSPMTLPYVCRRCRVVLAGGNAEDPANPEMARAWRDAVPPDIAAARPAICPHGRWADNCVRCALPVSSRNHSLPPAGGEGHTGVAPRRARSMRNIRSPRFGSKPKSHRSVRQAPGSLDALRRINERRKALASQ
jgi:hypothetical protein